MTETRAGAVYPLIVLRFALGVVYAYAGISKIADRRFLDRSDPTSMYRTVLAARSGSPIGSLLGPVVAHPTAVGLVIAVGEFAVGVGLLTGLFTRVAAAGGAVLALGLWLTVSWHAQPWYTSADLVYLVAFTPFLLGAGAGPWSVDGWLARVEQRGARADDAGTRRVLVAGLAVLGGALVLGAAGLARGRRGTPAAHGPIRLLPAGRVPVGGAVAADGGGRSFFVTRPDPDRYEVLDARCPHQGCSVQFVSRSDGFLCPCHQSRFTYDGMRTSGPAPRGLSRYPGTDEAGEIVVRT